MLVRSFALLGNRQLSTRIFQHARNLSQKPVSTWLESTKESSEQEKIKKITLIPRPSLITLESKNLNENPEPTQQRDNVAAFAAPVRAIDLVNSGIVGLTHRSLGLFDQARAHTQQVRCFHAKGSKVRYLDFRYKFNTCHLRSHLLIIRRQKMKKHRRKKWRKKFKTVLAKMRLKREIAKEKTFRVELLTMIKRAEQFDPREYALKKINEFNNRPKVATREERLEELKELIRKNRYQVDYIKPKHKRADI